MVIFPQLNSQGLMVQLPYSTSAQFNTVVADVPNGRPYTLQRRGSAMVGFPTGPLCKFNITLPHITDDELEVARAFFVSREGRLQEFVYLDPAGNLCNYSENFANAVWTKTATVGATGVADPFGGTAATTLNGTSSTSVYQSVIPSDANTMVVCASAWVKAVSSNQRLTVTIQKHASPFTVWGTQTWSLPVGQWVRIYATGTIGDTGAVRATFGGDSNWGATNITFFGPQCVPLPGPGAYAKTPGTGYGFHQHCRFDTDDFAFIAKGPNENQVILPVLEYNV